MAITFDYELLKDFSHNNRTYRASWPISKEEFEIRKMIQDPLADFLVVVTEFAWLRDEQPFYVVRMLKDAMSKGKVHEDGSVTHIFEGTIYLIDSKIMELYVAYAHSGIVWKGFWLGNQSFKSTDNFKKDPPPKFTNTPYKRKRKP